MTSFYVIVVAGGKGERFGGKTTKLLVPLAGRPIIAYSLEAAAKSGAERIVLVANRDFFPRFEEIARDVCGDKLFAVVPGGRTRTDSVREGLRVLEGVCPPEGVVLIHDGARPFAPPKLFDDCAEVAANYGAAVVAIPATDTLKVVENQFVRQTPPREKFYLAQTPQGFVFKIIRDALADDSLDFTDDAAAVELSGHRVRIVPGARTNIKITTPEDLALAECIWQKFFAGGS